jgi:Ca2+/Na+ antiporter
MPVKRTKARKWLTVYAVLAILLLIVVAIRVNIIMDAERLDFMTKLAAGRAGIFWKVSMDFFQAPWIYRFILYFWYYYRWVLFLILIGSLPVIWQYNKRRIFNFLSRIINDNSSVPQKNTSITTKDRKMKSMSLIDYLILLSSFGCFWGVTDSHWGEDNLFAVALILLIICLVVKIFLNKDLIAKIKEIAEKNRRAESD